MFFLEIFDIMKEGQQLEHMGFKLVPAVRMAIMRKSILFADFEAVNEMIEKYNGLMRQLSLSEVSSLAVALFFLSMHYTRFMMVHILMVDSTTCLRKIGSSNEYVT